MAELLPEAGLRSITVLVEPKGLQRLAGPSHGTIPYVKDPSGGGPHPLF